ncbi:MAG TPA: hypothetical protein VK530_04215 [Candidatus Acidoferrum sp.]|nr:hypothetical protein [Candidatus Acidoferrum sp.]
MNTTTFDILHPIREVKLSKRSITVRELPWKEQKLAVDKITKQITAIARPGASASAEKPAVSFEAIFAAINQSAELIEWLLLKSTDLAQEEIDNLTPTELFAVLEQVIDLNVGVHITGAKKIFGRIGTPSDNSAAVKTPTIPSASQSIS